MQFARECFLLKGELMPVIEQYQEAANFPELEGTSTLKLNSDFVAWQKAGAAAVHVSSIYIDGLPPGFYSVKAYSKDNITEATASKYGFKTMFFSTCNATNHLPTTFSYNTIVFPISLSCPQNQFSLSLLLTQKSQSVCASTPCPAKGNGCDALS